MVVDIRWDLYQSQLQTSQGSMQNSLPPPALLHQILSLFSRKQSNRLCSATYCPLDLIPKRGVEKKRKLRREENGGTRVYEMF